jgi:hypothetical protein
MNKGNTMAKVITFMADKMPDVSPEHRVLLLLDRHDSCLSVDALNEAMRVGVDIRLLMPNTTHFLQPWDQMFGCIKALYSRFVCNVPFVTDRLCNLRRMQWIGLCAHSIKMYTENNPNCMQRGFAETGLWALDVEVAVNAMHERVKQSSAAKKRTVVRERLVSSCIELNNRKRVRTSHDPAVPEALTGIALMHFRLKEVVTAEDRGTRSLPKHRVAAAKHAVITRPEFVDELKKIKTK